MKSAKNSDSNREKDIRFSLRVLSERRRNPVYLAHTEGTDPEVAAEQFERREGHEPEKQFTEYGLLLSGPVSEE